MLTKLFDIFGKNADRYLKSIEKDNIISLMDSKDGKAVNTGDVFVNMVDIRRLHQAWATRSTTTDPQFILYHNEENPLDAAKYYFITFDLFVNEATKGQLFWWLIDGQWQGSRHFIVKKGWNNYRFNMKTIPTHGTRQGSDIGWNDKVSKIRLDPAELKMVTIKIKNIKLTSYEMRDNVSFMPDGTKEAIDNENIKLNYEECAKLPRVLKSKPVLIYAEISTKCNLRCRMCGRAHYNIPYSQQGFMSRKIFEKLSTLFIPGVRLALFGRGESLLHPDIIYFLKIAGKAGVKTSFNTNGLALTGKIAKAMVENRQSNITFSCSAGSPETYKKIHCIDAWKRLWDNIDMLNDAKLKYSLNLTEYDDMSINEPIMYIEFVSQLSNISELPALLRKAFEHHIKGLVVVNLIAHSKEMENERMNLPKNIPIAEKYYSEARALHSELIRYKLPNFELRLPDSYSMATKKYTNKCEKDMLEKIETQLNNNDAKFTNKCFCLEPWQTFYVRFDGTVSPCCITGRSLGNLNKIDAGKIWNGEIYQKFRQKMKEENKPYECLRCHFFPGPKRYDKELDNIGQYEPI